MVERKMGPDVRRVKAELEWQVTCLGWRRSSKCGDAVCGMMLVRWRGVVEEEAVRRSDEEVKPEEREYQD